MHCSRDPILEDPYEQETVYVAPSQIGEAAGEGLFARKHIGRGQLVCLFSGIRCAKLGHHTRIVAGDPDWSDYRLHLGMSKMKNKIKMMDLQSKRCSSVTYLPIIVPPFSRSID